MKLLLFGCNGQVGWELQRSLTPLGTLIALDRHGREGLCGNLTRLEELSRTVETVKPDIIVNAAAYTAVDRAESEPELARRINAEAPAELARTAQKIGAWYVHYSTDYVFDGSGNQPWREADPASPLNTYGATKLQGETEIRQAGCRYFIFRTSWVYGARGNNFVRTTLRIAREGGRLQVVNDQIGAPTGAELLADVTAHALQYAVHRPEVSGIYHVAAAGETSWHGYARFIIEFARIAGTGIKVAADAIMPVATGDFPTPARRPSNSRLDTRKFQDTFQLNLPHWEPGVARMLNEVLEQSP